jgi:sporulation protein YlmC with PRC-barrel domain
LFYGWGLEDIGMRRFIILLFMALAVFMEFMLYEIPLAEMDLEVLRTVNVERLEDIEVLDRNGEEVGEVEGVYMDPGSGMINFLHVEGEGGADHLVPYDALDLRDNNFHLNMEEEYFDRAPAFDEDRDFEPGYLEDVRDFFGTERF